MKKFHYSLRFEILFVCFIISIVPIIVMQIVFYNLSGKYIEQKINALTSKNLNYIQLNIESDLDYYKGILYRIVADNDVTDDEVKVKNGSDSERESFGVKLRDSLAAYADIRDEIVGVTYVSGSLKSVFYDKRNMSADNYLWDLYSQTEKQDIYNTVHNSNRVVFFNTREYYYNNEKSYLYNIGLRVWNIKTGEDLGIVLLSIDEQRLQNICNLQSADATSNDVKEYSFAVDDAGKILSFLNKDYIGHSLSRNFGQNSSDIDSLLGSVSLNPKNGVIVNSVSIPDANWKIISLVDRDSMFYEINLLRKLTLTIAILILCLCTAFIILFTNKFYRSVNGIVKEIKRAKSGDFSAHIILTAESELVFIGNEFNDMVLKINSLVENLKKQNEYIYELSDRKREAEINAIIAQINPHFLYNTLDCINWIAIRNEDFEISQMIGNLADILRYSIRTINEQVTFYDAVEWLKKYLYLYSVRLHQSFTTNYDIDQDLLGCKIYKLLLQPIVENAVVHGFQGCDSEQVLSISIRKAGEASISIEISDNGVGIPADKLSLISDEVPNKKIGLNNVRERLKIYYKNAASMSIWSRENEGTRVTVVIPLSR